MRVRLPSLLLFKLCPIRNPNVNTQSPRHFRTSTSWRRESSDHYGVLGLESTASQSAIKNQFYALSKTHHPDHNPNDPTASERFVKISEAYAVLGHPEKRTKYDRDTSGATGGTQNPARRGSHGSSAFGSRPASGLSKRRTQFRGPPPSFYRSGGWGAQGTKRRSQADGSAAAAGSSGAAQGSETRSGGFGPGQARAGWDNDVPHFDREGHRRTQDQQERRRILRRRTGEDDMGYGGASMLIQFLLVGGVVCAAFSLPALFERRIERGHRENRDGGSSSL